MIKSVKRVISPISRKHFDRETKVGKERKRGKHIICYTVGVNLYLFGGVSEENEYYTDSKIQICIGMLRYKKTWLVLWRAIAKNRGLIHSQLLCTGLANNHLKFVSSSASVFLSSFNLHQTHTNPLS